ncbi:hypothetical protein HK405_013091, partial [Cladochytrium tenue]
VFHRKMAALGTGAVLRLSYVKPGTTEPTNRKVRLGATEDRSVASLVKLVASKLELHGATEVECLQYKDPVDGQIYELSDEDLEDVLEKNLLLNVVFRGDSGHVTGASGVENMLPLSPSQGSAKDHDQQSVKSPPIPPKVIQGHQAEEPDLDKPTQIAYARTLWYELDRTRGLHAFWDKKCLNNGEEWERGFLTGLSQCDVVVLLCSEDGLRRAQSAGEQPDNLILEWEIALELRRNKGVDVLPVFLKSKKLVRIPESGKEVKASIDYFPNKMDFPNAVHRHALSPHELSVRSVVEEISKLQAVIADPDDLQFSRVLWLQGSPGVGKSLMCAFVVSELKKKNLLGGMFFCRYDNESMNSARNLITTLCFYLCLWSNNFAELVDKIRSENPSVLSYPTGQLFNALIHSPLSALYKSAPNQPPVVLCVDALDECGRLSYRRDILQVFAQSCKKLPEKVKIFVTSRPEADIVDAFKDLTVEELQPTVSDARGDALEFAKQKLVRLGADEEALSKGPGLMCEKSEGAFIWLDLACKALEGRIAEKVDLRMIISGSDDRTIRVWDAKTGRLQKTLDGQRSPIRSVAYGPDGQCIIASSEDLSAVIWELATAKSLHMFKDCSGPVAFSPDAKCPRVAVGLVGTDICVWAGDAFQERTLLVGHKERIYSVAFSVDGRRIVSGSNDGTARIWDAATGNQLAVLEGHESRSSVTAAAFSPDGWLVVTGSSDKTVRIWDSTTGLERAALEGHYGQVSAVAFSPDGSRVLSACWDVTAINLKDNTIRLWDFTTGRQLAKMSGHSDRVDSAVFSPDGLRIFSGSWDKTVRVWDTAAAEQEGVSPDDRSGHLEAVYFSPDGRLALNLFDSKAYDLVTGDTVAVENAAVMGWHSGDNSGIKKSAGDLAVREPWVFMRQNFNHIVSAETPLENSESVRVRIDFLRRGHWCSGVNQHHVALQWLVSSQSTSHKNGLFRMVPYDADYDENEEDEEVGAKIEDFNMLPADEESFLDIKHEGFRVFFDSAQMYNNDSTKDADTNPTEPPILIQRIGAGPTSIQWMKDWLCGVSIEFVKHQISKKRRSLHQALLFPFVPLARAIRRPL